MKYFVLILMAALLYVGCGDQNGNGGSGETNGTDTTEAPDFSNENLLRYHPEEGKTYTYHLTTINDQVGSESASQKFTMNGWDTTVTQSRSQHMQDTSTYHVDIKILDRDSKGVISAEFKVTKVRVSLDSDGEKMVFETGQELEDTTEMLEFSQYKALAKGTFNARITPIGEVLDIYKAEEIRDEVLVLTQQQDSLSVNQKSMLYANLTEGLLRPLAAQIFRELPEYEVAQDSSWSNINVTADRQIYTLAGTRKFTLTGYEEKEGDKIAVIEAVLINDSQVNKELAKQNNITINRPEYEGEGTLKFNLNSGMFEGSTTQVKSSVTMSGSMTDQRGITQTQTSTEKINTSSSLELIEVK